MTELLFNQAAYKRIIQEEIPLAKRFLWISTADLKDLHVEVAKKKFVPFVGVLAELVARGVGVRLIHAKEPGPLFRKDFDRFPDLINSDLFERVLCPRMHAKIIIIDGNRAFLGSANLTGAGIGAKSPRRRNFEAGVFTKDLKMVGELCQFYDEFWIGNSCVKCGLRNVCPDPIC